MNKKLLTGAILVSLSLILTGCASNNDDNGTTSLKDQTQVKQEYIKAYKSGDVSKLLSLSEGTLPKTEQVLVPSNITAPSAAAINLKQSGNTYKVVNSFTKLSYSSFLDAKATVTGVKVNGKQKDVALKTKEESETFGLAGDYSVNWQSSAMNPLFDPTTSFLNVQFGQSDAVAVLDTHTVKLSSYSLEQIKGLYSTAYPELATDDNTAFTFNPQADNKEALQVYYQGTNPLTVQYSSSTQAWQTAG